ncbi:hypothetical protein I79_004963 [Cricetulus griseus]|uniref:Uncharacterized protein n=1 Tax=Cricetulus griseus TaxID=10029 RepID=G3H3X2_CRIGR|nr:hypothetical protein I79_004963 [Cricetulus griseus]
MSSVGPLTPKSTWLSSLDSYGDFSCYCLVAGQVHVCCRSTGSPPGHSRSSQLHQLIWSRSQGS